eukprot:COSAG05_NODE_1121_length_5808_cov_2.774391_2_plen_191_part_00
MCVCWGFLLCQRYFRYTNIRSEDDAARRYRLLNRPFEMVDVEELRDRLTTDLLVDELDKPSRAKRERANPNSRSVSRMCVCVCLCVPVCLCLFQSRHDDDDVNDDDDDDNCDVRGQSSKACCAAPPLLLPVPWATTALGSVLRRTLLHTAMRMMLTKFVLISDFSGGDSGKVNPQRALLERGRTVLDNLV